MIRTEDDLRAALRALEDDAPQLSDVLPSGATPLPLSLATRAATARRRRRFVPVAAAVVAILGVSAGVAALHDRVGRDPVPPDRETASTPAAAAPVAVPNAARVGRVDFGLGPVAGYYVTERAATELFQRITLAAKMGAAPTVTEYRPGTYPGPTSGRPVRVGTVAGFVVTDAHPAYVAYRATDPAQHRRAVVWQYAPRSWAMATGAPGRSAAAVDAGNLLLARAARPAQTHLSIPFRLGYLPAGLAADSAYQDPKQQLDPEKQRIGPSAPYGGVSLRDSTPPAAPSKTVSWGAAFDIIAFAQPTLPVSPVACDVKTARTFTIGADRGCFIQHDDDTAGLLITVHGHAVRLLLNSSHYGTYPDSQLVRILAHLSLTPTFHDVSSWYPV